ncbi:MAG: Hpt domain-containing protein [Clostridiales bacterium]|nr:Hpt domain-containing protein [Clostridiales bacterium]
MPTIEELKNYGANTDEALSRLMGNESFYLMLIPKVFDDKNFDQLSASIAEGDLDKAFEAAHSLKGVLGNLELTPILKPVIEITELLRHKEQADYAPLVEEILKQKEALMSLFTDR